jgi:hypothetical protein
MKDIDTGKRKEKKYRKPHRKQTVKLEKSSLFWDKCLCTRNITNDEGHKHSRDSLSDQTEQNPLLLNVESNEKMKFE